MLRIEAIATAIGISTAGAVPKTKKRITSAPRPPINASTSTLGPLPPLESPSTSGSRPVRYDCTPLGVAALSAASTWAMCSLTVKSSLPGG